jgi:hypothetical protein
MLFRSLIPQGCGLHYVRPQEMEALLVLVSVVGCVSIAGYATWLLAHRLRAGESPRRSFLEWLKHLAEAVWGL